MISKITRRSFSADIIFLLGLSFFAANVKADPRIPESSVREPIDPHVGRITGDVVNVRNIPSTGGVVIGSVTQDQLVKIVDWSATESTIDGKKSSWCKVQPKNGKTGWVFGAYLERDPVAAARSEKELEEVLAAEREWKVETNQPDPPLTRAIFKNNIPGVALFAARKGDLNAKWGSQGKSPLQAAISYSKVGPEMAHILIKAGADVNHKDSLGGTALMALGSLIDGGKMSDAERRKLAEALIAAGADVNARDVYGKSALMTSSHRTVVQTLLAAKADIKALDRNGRTVLYHAAANDSVEVIKMLLDAGADVNGRSRDGSTALMAAAQGNRIEAVKALIELRGSRFFGGLDLNAKNNDGKTALSLASRYPEVVKLLKEAGAK